MSIEAGARAGLIAPDETTFAYLRGRPGAPSATGSAALERWRALRTDDDAVFDRELEIDVSRDPPAGHLGHEPRHGRADRRRRPRSGDIADADERAAAERALAYMALEPGTPIREIDGRPRLHRLVHELAHRGSARRRRRRARAATCIRPCARWSSPARRR